MVLASDLAVALDPVLLMKRLGLTPDAWQEEALRSSRPRILLNCCRQSGKSLVAALLAVHAAVYEPGAPVLLLSRSLRQSQELFRTALTVYRALDEPVPMEAESALRLELANGSRIISLPGKEATVRGFAGVRFLIIDEAARVPDDLYYTVRPMLAVSGGRLMALSTPWGRRGWWWRAWGSEESWLRFEVPATQCPRISPEFLVEERVALGDWWYRQEYECAFEDNTYQVFPTELVLKAFSEEIPVLFKGVGAPVGGLDANVEPLFLASPPEEDEL